MKYSFLTTFFFGIILTYFLIRLTLCHETESKKFKNIVHRERLNPFWRIISATKVLPKDQPPFPSISISPFPSTQQSLYHRRGVVSLDLSHCLGIRTNRNVPPPKTKRCLPVPHGTSHLSQSHHVKTLSSSDGSFSTPQIEEPPRQTSFVYDPKTDPSHQGNLRSGFHRPYPLWKTGDGSDRLQSPEVGSPLLSPPCLFQWDHQGFLAWRTPPWRHPYSYWNRGTSQGSLYQITSLCKDRNYSSRQGFLRSRNHRISGIQQSPFCHCCQAYQSSQENNLNPLLSGPFFWHRDSGVYVSTHQVEKGISLCGGQASHPRRPYGTTYPLFNGQVQLSGYCNEHEINPSQYLEVLQWPSRCRTHYQRTERGLPFRKNSDKTLRSQRGLFPYPFIFLQPDQLVQATLLANGVSEYDA